MIFHLFSGRIQTEMICTVRQQTRKNESIQARKNKKEEKRVRKVSQAICGSGVLSGLQVNEE